MQVMHVKLKALFVENFKSTVISNLLNVSSLTFLLFALSL